MSLPYYKRFPRDFLDGTIGMSLETKGAYAIVLDMIYMRDGRLPDDARYIAGQLGCSVRKWTAILAELVEAGKLRVADGIISNSRADYLVEETRKYRDKQSEIATKPRKNSELAQPEPSQSDTDTEEEPPNPLPLNLRPLARLIELSGEGSWSEVAERAYQLQPEPGGKRRSTRPDVRGALEAALRRGAKPGEPLAALAAYYRLPECRKENGQYASGAKVILTKDRWKDFLPSLEPPKRVTMTPEFRAHCERHHAVTGEWLGDPAEKPKLAA